LLGDTLKRAGHTRYFENSKKIFAPLKDEYKSEFSEDELKKLQNYNEQVSPLLLNIQRNTKSDHVIEYTHRIRSELERLIHMQEKNQF
jgi:HD superfamily phosphodiesterase